MYYIVKKTNVSYLDIFWKKVYIFQKRKEKENVYNLDVILTVIYTHIKKKNIPYIYS